MKSNAQVISDFYNAFMQRDFRRMQDAYADEATFSDPVFQNLNAAQVRQMWEMLIKRGKDLNLTFSNVAETEDGGQADWIASYTFSQTGRKVINHIHAEFRIRDGKITAHKDSFNLRKWASMALGMPGVLLGWTPFLQNKIRQNAMKGLKQYMEKTASAQMP